MILRPGSGWSRAGAAPVYDHAPTGIRVHIFGVCRTPSGDVIDGNDVRHYGHLSRSIRIAGGNRKRGVMVWALNHHHESTTNTKRGER